MKPQVTIIGAGPAGIGMAVLLKHMKIPFIVLEKNTVGASFLKWPKEMRLISPSFTGNFFGAPDLNAISPYTSPAYSLKTEHPTGPEYAQYLKDVVEGYQIPVEFGHTVTSLQKQDGMFSIQTDKSRFMSKFVIWAGGEYQFPNDKPFEGSEHCIHNSKIDTWEDLKGDEFVVIGGYESGIDAAFQLAKLGKKVKVLDATNHLIMQKSDSSYSLSPFTQDRYNENKAKIKIRDGFKVNSVEKLGKDEYRVNVEGQAPIISKTQPILATGFKSSLSSPVINELFEFKEDVVQLTAEDESTITPGLFLSGPQVQHDDVIFCFIYKFRQRFAVVAEEIAERLGRARITREVIEDYKENNFYLKDLSCCGDECAC